MKKNVIKISGTYKFCVAAFNTLGKIEKTIAFTALGVTVLKIFFAIGMDATKKNFKN